MYTKNKQRRWTKKKIMERKKKEKRAEIAQKSTSIVSGDSPSTGTLWVNKVILCYHEGNLHWLDHVFVAPNIVSLWNANFIGPQFVQSSAFQSQFHCDMMDYVGSVESLHAIKIFLGRSVVVVRHWKETMSKTGEKTKAMAAQLKVMKVEVNKSKQLN